MKLPIELIAGAALAGLALLVLITTVDRMPGGGFSVAAAPAVHPTTAPAGATPKPTGPFAVYTAPSSAPSAQAQNKPAPPPQPAPPAPPPQAPSGGGEGDD